MWNKKVHSCVPFFNFPIGFIFLIGTGTGGSNNPQQRKRTGGVKKRLSFLLSV